MPCPQQEDMAHVPKYVQNNISKRQDVKVYNIKFLLLK